MTLETWKNQLQDKIQSPLHNLDPTTLTCLISLLTISALLTWHMQPPPHAPCFLCANTLAQTVTPPWGSLSVLGQLENSYSSLFTYLWHHFLQNTFSELTTWTPSALQATWGFLDHRRWGICLHFNLS